MQVSTRLHQKPSLFLALWSSRWWDGLTSLDRFEGRSDGLKTTFVDLQRFDFRVQCGRGHSKLRSCPQRAGNLAFAFGQSRLDELLLLSIHLVRQWSIGTALGRKPT